MNIALVCDWYAPRLGGIEVHLEALAERLKTEGHTVQVITTTPGPRAPGVVRVSAPLVPGVGVMYTRAGLRALDAALAAGDFDVVHAHISIVSPAAIGAGALANRRGIPLVVTFHSWIPGMRALTRLIGGALGSRRWTAIFTAVSGRVAREVAPCAPGEVEVLPNGVASHQWGQHRLIPPAETPPEFQEGQSRSISPLEIGPKFQEGQSHLIPLQHAATGNSGASPGEPGRAKYFAPDFQAMLTPRLVSVMRLNAKKRPLALVWLMGELRRRLPAGISARLCIVGDGPQRARVESAVARAGLQDCVELLGRRTHDEIRALYQECDAFVLPTIRESFGIAAAEARSAGLPVVARGGGGVDDWIEHGKSGLLAATDGELVDAVLQLITDHELRARIALHNRTTTPSVDWAPVLARHLELYARAIALRRSVSA